MRLPLSTSLFLGAAVLALSAPGAGAQPLRTAAAVPAVGPAPAGAQSAAFSAAPATTSAAPAPAPVAPVPAAASAAAAPQNTSDGIAATVGDNSISDFELQQRVDLFFATSGFKPTPDDIKRARKI